MNTKSKVILSISILCIALVIAIVAVVAVFAAQTQTVTSAINVTYTVTEVSGSVQSWYKVGGEETEMGTKIPFAPGDPQSNKSMNPGDIKLSATNKYVVFKYHFEADTATPYTATLTFTGTASNKNMVITYASSSQDDVTDDKISTAAEGTITGGVTFGDNVTVSQEGEVYYYVKVAISSVKEDASFIGTFHWDLNAVVT